MSIGEKKATVKKRKPGRNPEPRFPLTREQVLRAAIDLADRGGIDAVSMRELGRKLGVEAMSLYNHISNKDDLLDGMMDLVAGEIDLPAAETDWREAMRVRAVSARAAFTRHPWAAGLIDSRVRGGPGRLRYFEAILGALRKAGFTLAHAARAFSLIDSYIYGFCRQSASIVSAEGADAADSAAAFSRSLPVGEYPHLAQMAAMQAAKPGYDEEADFEFGLKLILDGLQEVLNEDQRIFRKPDGGI